MTLTAPTNEADPSEGLGSEPRKRRRKHGRCGRHAGTNLPLSAATDAPGLCVCSDSTLNEIYFHLL